MVSFYWTPQKLWVGSIVNLCKWILVQRLLMFHCQWQKFTCCFWTKYSSSQLRFAGAWLYWECQYSSLTPADHLGTLYTHNAAGYFVYLMKWRDYLKNNSPGPLTTGGNEPLAPLGAIPSTYSFPQPIPIVPIEVLSKLKRYWDPRPHPL